MRLPGTKGKILLQVKSGHIFVVDVFFAEPIQIELRAPLTHEALPPPEMQQKRQHQQTGLVCVDLATHGCTYFTH